VKTVLRGPISWMTPCGPSVPHSRYPSGALLTSWCTPYKLVYRKACHLPIELEHKAYWALKHCNYDLVTAGLRSTECSNDELNDFVDQHMRTL
ncbi:hypothetical protein Tco_1074306, partial [Tanacetum coccineum]